MSDPSAEIWSVSQLTRRIKALIEGQVGGVWVSGEISNWKLAASGHAYFTLKDSDSQIDAVMFKGKLDRVRFTPEAGLEILAHGSVTVYERRGNYQIVIDDMQPRGMGALQLAFEKLKKKLSDEGLFDEAHKKPLPLLPKRIGIVTSPTGAAIRDILNVLGRRFANVHVILHPARVQGTEAAAEIAAGIRALDAWGVDVMIVGRGGGSLEDLWPFNEEPVVRAVFEAKTPIISAVGHEIDFSLTDFAADLRAPTPSAAAELVVRERQALADAVAAYRRRLAEALGRKAERLRHRLDSARGSFVFRRPEDLLRQQRQALDEVNMRLEESLRSRVQDYRTRWEHAARALKYVSPAKRVERAHERLASLRGSLLRSGKQLSGVQRARLEGAAGKLHALSPLAILGRGYGLTWKEPEHVLVRDAATLRPGDSVRLRFARGSATAKIATIEEAHDGQA
jgi:exodeoxyribonuclease VII large subunit